MSTVAELEKRIEKLEKLIASAPPPANDYDPSTDSYVDDVVKKSPPRFEGRDLTGVRYSELSGEEIKALLGLERWKLKKQKTENQMWTSPKTGETKAVAEFTQRTIHRLEYWLARV